MSVTDEGMQPLSPSQRELLEEATQTYEWDVTDADQWLNARGITTETAASFRLGVVGSEPYSGHGHCRGCLVIPYLGHRDQPLSMRFRCIQDHEHVGHGKYMSITGEPVRMFNVRVIHRAGDEIHVCEGELDAIILNQLGLPAVAIPGALLWRDHHRRMLAGFSRVWTWADPDDAGAELNNKISRSLRAAKAVRLKGGDVTDTYLQGGAAAIFDLIGRKESASE